MRIDNHVHIGVDPMFYLRGFTPYCLDLVQLLVEARDTGIDRWVIFPFVAYLALDFQALREGKLQLSDSGNEKVPYQFENRRLLDEIKLLGEGEAEKFWPFLMADPGRCAAAQVREWESLVKTHKFHGIKIQPTILQSEITSLLGEAKCMVDFASERNLPFLIHSSISPTDRWSQCADILRVVESRPDVRFVLAHSCRFHHASLKRVAELPNAWFDCSAHGIHCDCAVQDLSTVAVSSERFPSDYSSPGTVLRDLAEAFPNKLIWGSDAPFYSYSDVTLKLLSSYEKEISYLNALPEELREKISHRNTLAWLRGD